MELSRGPTSFRYEGFGKAGLSVNRLHLKAYGSLVQPAIASEDCTGRERSAAPIHHSGTRSAGWAVHWHSAGCSTPGPARLYEAPDVAGTPTMRMYNRLWYLVGESAGQEPLGARNFLTATRASCSTVTGGADPMLRCTSITPLPPRRTTARSPCTGMTRPLDVNSPPTV